MKKILEKIKGKGIFYVITAAFIAVIALIACLALETPELSGGDAPGRSTFASRLVATFPFMEDIVKGLLPDSAIVGYQKGSKEGSLTEDQVGNNFYDLKEIDKEQYKYMDETSYKGNKKVSLENFSEPFQKTAGSNYVNNIETLKRMDSDVKAGMFETAAAFVNDMFNVDYHAIQTDPDSYKAKLYNYYQPGTGLYMPDGAFFKPEYVVDYYVNWIVDSKIQTESIFKTDESLIYVEDNITYIRGELDISSYSCDDDDGKCNYIPEKINMKDDGKYIFEVGIAYYGDWYKGIVPSPYCICSYNVIKVE